MEVENPIERLPRISPDPGGVSQLVRWVSDQLRRVRWSAEELEQRYCARSPLVLLEEGTLGFTAPCADLCSLVALGLVEVGISPTLILAGIARRWQPVKFQCGLELELEGGTWVVGFGVSSTYFYEGRFVETRRRPQVLRRRPESWDPSRSFLEWCDPRGLPGLAELIPGYDLGRDLRDHARRNGRLRFALARRRAQSVTRARRQGRIHAPGRWD